jgi:hypothetical protein
MQLIQKDLLRTYTLEITGIIGQTSFTFPDIPFLRNKISYGIDASVNQFMVTTGKTNLFSQTTFIGDYAGFITLIDSENIQFVQNMPVLELLALQYLYIDESGTPGVQANTPYNTNGTIIFKERIVQWNKCTMYFPVSPITTTSQGFQFTIYYK